LFFQDPSTAFAYHLIYTHNIIHWYLIIILFFVYFTMFYLLKSYSWNIHSKNRGILTILPLLLFFADEVSIFVLKRLYTIYSIVTDSCIEWMELVIRTSYPYVPRLQYYGFLKQFVESLENDYRQAYPHQPLQQRQADPSNLMHLKPTPLDVFMDYCSWEPKNIMAFASIAENIDDYEDNLFPPEDLAVLASENLYWIALRALDIHLVALFSKKYSLHQHPYNAFFLVQKGNDSRLFEYICVFLPTTVVVTILSHSLSLLYSGAEEISPGLHFTAIGHQWFWSYEVEAYIKKHFTETDYKLFQAAAAFDSVPIAEDNLSRGAKRLLEVDNPLVLPVGVPIKALATSGDVLHSWAVPEMAIKIDAVPGRLNDSLTYIQRPGVFYGQCSELCGVGHGFMPIVVEALDIENFAHWCLLHNN
jgi:cytochrome c oxidase subunit 2